MSQKIFLTSALAMGVMAPAIAEPSHTGEFPSDGYMEEDYTYTNAATSDNMDGVYSGTVNAVAEYDIIDYIVNAGQYLPADSETVITCPAGSYCPGISGNVQYNQSTPQGIQTCPTGYANSAAGASSDTQCYRQCSGNVTIEHATGVTGNDYYGNGTDTCEPTGCVNGWHVKAAIPDLTTAIGNVKAVTAAYVNGFGTFSEKEFVNYTYSSINEQAYYGLTENNTWAIDYGANGMLKGQARCSTQSGVLEYDYNTYTLVNITIKPSLTDETGRNGAVYCYCNITGYIPDGGTLQSVSSPWLFVNDRGAYGGSVSNCTGGCTSDCISYFGSNSSGTSPDLAMRTTMFNSLGTPGPAMCEANTITINWSDAAQTDIDANNAGTATYGEDVRTPVKAATKKGQTFRGWRFSKPEQTNLPE